MFSPCRSDAEKLETDRQITVKYTRKIQFTESKFIRYIEINLMDKCLNHQAMEPVHIFNHVIYLYISTWTGYMSYMFCSFHSAYNDFFQNTVYQNLVEFCRKALIYRFAIREKKVKFGKISAIYSQQLCHWLFPSLKITSLFLIKWFLFLHSSWIQRRVR